MLARATNARFVVRRSRTPAEEDEVAPDEAMSSLANEDDLDDWLR